jgi:hypothetical protein
MGVRSHRSRKIFYEILDIFYPNAKADDIFGQSSFLTYPRINTGVAHTAWHADKAVDTAKTDTDPPKPGRFYDLL